MATLAAGRALRALKRRGGTSTAPPRPNDRALPPPEERGGTLSPQQIRYFETFGFLVLPGLFAEDFEQIERGFEQVFADHPHMETHEQLHFNQTRMTIPAFVRKSPLLEKLPTDPRVVGIVESLLGEHFVDTESDGNLFFCESSWHPDTYGAPMTDHHVKVSMYLDPLAADSGAIRLMPGTNHYQDAYALSLRQDIDDPVGIEALFGMSSDQLPSYAIESHPGDAVVWDFRTVHASFNGGARRRLLSLNFRQVPADSSEG